MKNALISIALSLVGIIIALGILEIGVRTFAPAGRSNAGPGWSDRPVFYFRAEGVPTMQGMPYQVPKPPSTFRIAVIGDSFSFAPFMQFNDTFAAKLQTLLSLNNTPLRAEVINYGVPAYSSTHEVAVTRRALEEGADLVLLQITLNDPEVKPARPTGITENMVDKFGPLKLQGTVAMVARYWRTLEFALERMHNSKTRQAYIDYFNDLYDNPRSYLPFADALRDMSNAARKTEIPIIAVVFPLFGLPMDDAYPFYPLHEKVKGVLKSNGVPHLDVSSIYQGIPLERLQVIPGVDRHPNEIAHRMAAERIYLWLEELNLLPKELLITEKFATRLGVNPQRAWTPPPTTTPNN